MIRLLLLLGMLWYLPASFTLAESSSSSIYSDVEQSVYQVRVINRASGKKTAIGSGFVVQAANILATNYHVVSTYVNHPEEYELDYLSTTGKTGRLELLSVDVIHDLAVLRAENPLGKAMHTGPVPPKGARLYSLGNPLDKGFSMVEGTNNGIMSSGDGYILLSGNLNPGMSGGPALNENKEVVGINVATSGNGISFLVPASYLSVMLERLRLSGFQADIGLKQQIGDQLRDHAGQYLQTLQDATWTGNRIGSFYVPSEIEGFTRCSDSSNDNTNPDELVRVSGITCDNESSIYLEEGVEVGRLTYEYVWLNGGNMLPARFYHYYESLNGRTPDSEAGEEDVTNFQCHTDFTLVSNQEFKLTVCRRDYLNYADLSDLLVTGALVGHKQQGMLVNLDMQGVTFEEGMMLLQRLLGEMKWQS